jgi:hypothetical protein
VPSIEALHRRGLLDDLELPKPGVQFGPQTGHFADIPFHRDDVDASAGRDGGTGSRAGAPRAAIRRAWP